jgi:hypothetical protein
MPQHRNGHFGPTSQPGVRPRRRRPQNGAPGTRPMDRAVQMLSSRLPKIMGQSAGAVGRQMMGPAAGAVGRQMMGPAAGAVGRQMMGPAAGAVGRQMMGPAAGAVGRQMMGPAAGALGRQAMGPIGTQAQGPGNIMQMLQALRQRRA